jgi:hypothetical protein
MFSNQEDVQCCVCGIVFGMPERYVKARRNDHKEFYCPNGHNQAFLGKTEGENAIEALKQAKVEHERLLSRYRAMEQEAAKYKCPSCKKSYTTAAKLLKHERELHRAPLRLAKDAGPDALNSDVRSE